MCWTDSPTLDDGVTQFLAASGGMKANAVGAYILLSTRISRHGPVLDDLKSLAEIMRVGVKTAERKIIPIIRHLFAFDGGVVDIPAARQSVRNLSAPKPAVDPELSRKRSLAALARYPDSPLHAKAAANLQEGDAKSDANSTVGDENLQAGLQGLAPAPLSLSEGTSDSTEEEESPSQRERGAGAGAHEDANLHAKSPAADLHAKSPTKGGNAPVHDHLPESWQPNEEAHQEARERSVNVFDVARKFRIWAHDENIRSRAWDARFLKFMMDERYPDRAQTSIPHVIKGGGGASSGAGTAPAALSPADTPVWTAHNAVFAAWNECGRPGQSPPSWPVIKGLIAHARDEVLDGLELHLRWYKSGRVGDQPQAFWKNLAVRDASRSSGDQAAVG